MRKIKKGGAAFFRPFQVILHVFTELPLYSSSPEHTLYSDMNSLYLIGLGL